MKALEAYWRRRQDRERKFADDDATVRTGGVRRDGGTCTPVHRRVVGSSLPV
jgi:hypothetical protein